MTEGRRHALPVRAAREVGGRSTYPNQIVRLIESAPPLTEAYIKRITEAAATVQHLNEHDRDQK